LFVRRVWLLVLWLSFGVFAAVFVPPVSNTTAEPILTPQAFLPLVARSPTPGHCPSPLPTTLLPPLYVDGPYVKRCDTREVVWLKGVQVVEFQDNGDSRYDHLWGDGLKKIVNENWGVNYLRIGIEDDTVESVLPELDKAIRSVEALGMYCILVPFASSVNPDRDSAHQRIPDEQVATAMGHLAGVFKGRSNVLYGLWNEPNPENIPPGLEYQEAWEAWMEAGIRVAQAIRANNPDSVLVVPGGRLWARDLTYYKDHPFPFDNVIYDVHDYWTPPSYYTREMWTWMIGERAVTINEFGGACCPWSDPPLQSDFDINYMREVMEIVNQNANKVHYSMWGLYWWDDGAIFRGPSLELTRRGALLKEDLANYPPTRFR
jgi:hypothetical protein